MTGIVAAFKALSLEAQTEIFTHQYLKPPLSVHYNAILFFVLSAADVRRNISMGFKTVSAFAPIRSIRPVRCSKVLGFQLKS